EQNRPFVLRVQRRAQDQSEDGGPERAAPRRHLQGATQDQFAASFRSPVPLYFAYCGYAHSGRDSPDVLFTAAIVIGACPFSRHFSSVPIESNESGPSPPRQWPMPGTMKSRAKSVVSLPIFFVTLW